MPPPSVDTSPSASPRGWSELVVRAALIAGAYCFAATLGLMFRSEPQKHAVFWPPNGLLLGLLLLGDRRDRRLAVFTAALTCLIANLVGGNSFAVSLGFTLVNIAEPGLACWLLYRLWRAPIRLQSTNEVFLLFAVALATTFVTAFAGAAVVVLGLGAPDYWGVFASFWLSDAMGVMIVTPLLLVWAGARRTELKGLSVGRVLEGGVLGALLVVLAVLIFDGAARTEHYLLSYPFPLFPLFVWVALRFGLRGATAALLGVALISIWYTGRGRGPFAEPGVPVTVRLLMVQFFVSTLGAGALTLGASLAERRAAQDALRESEERYRQVTETMEEAFWVLAPDRSATLYLSPAYERIWGRTCASAYADIMSFLEGVHPDDRARVRAALPKQIEGTYHEEYRVVRPDGTVRWVRSRAFALRDETGTVVRIVGVSQDVTDRKEAELTKESLIDQLQKALAEVSTLRGMIPICAWCRKVRDDGGFWQSVEEYICTHTQASITHSMCPACFANQMQTADAAKPAG